MTKQTKRPKYRVLVGINYPPGDKRAEPGDVVDDIPPSSIGWLVRDGIVKPVGDSIPLKRTEQGG
jgi:hypothetical protein